MGLIAWHFSKGIEFYVKSFENFILGIIHNFSFGTLIRTLFAPWKRLTIREKRSGFNLQKFLEDLTFNLISRGVGFSVRVILIVSGILILLISSILGMILFLIFAIFPPLSIPFYMSYRKSPQIQIKNLVRKLKESSKIEVLFDSHPGKFVIVHTGINIDDLISSSDKNTNISLKDSYSTFSDLLSEFVNAGFWNENFFRKHGITKENFVFTADWWDEIGRRRSKSSEKGLFVGPSIALSLVYGYTPILNQYSSDLTLKTDFSHHLIGREEVVLKIENTLSSGKSVFLLGDSGVGKKTVILEFAKRASMGELGKKLAYRRILEFDYNALIAGSGDVNEKKTLLQEALIEGASAGNILLAIRDFHRITSKDVEGYDFTDVFEKILEEKELKIVAFGTRVDYERFLQTNSRLRNHFDVVEVNQPTVDEAFLILRDGATDWEKKKGIVVRIQALRKILDGCDKYVTDTPFPEKALELLDAAAEISIKDGYKTIDESVATKILSDKTGIPFAQITSKEKEILINLEDTIHKSLVNQDTAVNLIAKALRSRSVDVSSKERPVGSFLFLGPTGVGKTETAKVLSQVYYGSEDAMVRFDMAKYSDTNISSLIGSKTGEPGDLTTAIKNHPASLILLDEIEKAGKKVHDILLTVLDEGYITDQTGGKIKCTHTFIIGTSNAAASYIWELVKKGVKGEKLQEMVVKHILENNLFSPEFINRFDGVVVYEPLSENNLIEVSKLMLDKFAQNLKKQGIELVVDDGLVKKVARDGYDPAFGARPMRKIIDLILGDLVGNAILKNEAKDGDEIKILPLEEKDKYNLQIIAN